MMWPLTLAALLLLAPACGSPERSSGPAASPSTLPTDERTNSALQRITRSFAIRSRWEAICTPDGCGGLPIAWVDLATPGSPSDVSVAVIATFDFAVAGGDSAEAELVYTPARGAPGPRLTLPPGRFPIRPSNDSLTDSITLSWGKRQIAGKGQEYSFQLEILAKDDSGDSRASVSGSKVTLIVELWTVDT